MNGEMPTIYEVLDTAQTYVLAMNDNDREKARAAWKVMDSDEWLPLSVYLNAMDFVMAYEHEQIGADEV